MEIYELEEHCERQLDRLPKTSKGYEEHLLTLAIIKTNRQYFNELDKKDKQIDLMAQCIDIELSSLRLSIILNKNVKPLESYKDEIKQYFEKKAEQERGDKDEKN